MKHQRSVSQTWDVEADVVVVGFGAAGMATAVTAHDLGAKVVILEKAPEGQEGGNTRVAGQGYLNTSSAEQAVAYLTALYPDPFYKSSPLPPASAPYGSAEPYYCYASGNIYFGQANLYNSVQYTGSIFSVASRGPDGVLLFGGYCLAHPESLKSEAPIRGAYDPTNGTVSEGDIFRLSSGTLGRAE